MHTYSAVLEAPPSGGTAEPTVYGSFVSEMRRLNLLVPIDAGLRISFLLINTKCAEHSIRRRSSLGQVEQIHLDFGDECPITI